MAGSPFKTLSPTTVWGALILILVLAVIPLAAVPPVSKDALVHHLAVPKIYLRHGGMVELPSMRFSYYPMNLDLLYGVALYLGNDILPKYMHFAFALGTAWCLFLFLKRRLSPAYGALGALLFLSIPIILKLSITVYVDLGVVFFITCSTLILIKWLENGMRFRYLTASAFFCGLAVGTKYNGLIALFLLTLSVPLLYSRKAPAVPGRSVRALGLTAAFFLVVVLVCSPWFTRNYHWTGNPLHPLYSQWFQPKEGDVVDVISTGAAPTEVGHGTFTYRREVYGESGWDIALLPIRIFFQGKDGNPRYFDGRLHPFLLILPLFAFMRSREGPEAERLEKSYLLCFAVLFFGFAFFSQGLRVRYIAPIIPPLVILSVFGLRNLMAWIQSLSSPRTIQAGLLMLGAAMLAIALYSAGYLVEQYRIVQPFGYLTGEVSRDAYITARRPEYPVAQCVNRETRLDSKVLLVFMGKRGYYLDRDYIVGVDRLGEIVKKKAGTSEGVAQALRKDGITHLMAFLPILERWARDNLDGEKMELMKRFFREHTRPLCLHEGYGVFRINGGGG